MEKKEKLSVIYVDGLHTKFFVLCPEYKLFFNDLVIVNISNCLYVGEVILPCKEYDINDLPCDLVELVRLVSDDDLDVYYSNINISDEAIEFARNTCKTLNLDMNFVDSYYNFDRSQLLLNYVSDKRIDFRELARVLAKKYRTRIELRQIAVRDRAKLVGGIGPCGLYLCCNRFLNDLSSVSINMAKNQNLVLTPSKLNGVCGRLMCCLAYEDSTYSLISSKLPRIGKQIKTPDGVGIVSSINFLDESYIVKFNEDKIIRYEIEI